MRWSLFSIITLLVILIVDVTALPTPQDGLELGLERRAITKPKKKTQTKSKSKSLKASHFKKASSTYRNAALRSTHHTLSVKSGKIVKSKPLRTMPKHLDADHIFEAHTMKVAAQRGGHTLTSLAPAMKDIKDRINDPKNMAFLDPATNQAKGRAHTAVLSGKTPVKDANVAAVLKQHSAAGKSTAADLDNILAGHGITGIDVSKAHNEVLKAHGVKRREYSEELD